MSYKQTFHWLIFHLNVCVGVWVLSLCATITDSKRKETQTVWLCLVDTLGSPHFNGLKEGRWFAFISVTLQGRERERGREGGRKEGREGGRKEGREEGRKEGRKGGRKGEKCHCWSW